MLPYNKIQDNNIKQSSRLIAKTILNQESSMMQVNNLHIKKGESVDIVINEWATGNTGSGHLLRINNLDHINGSYKNFHQYAKQTNDGQMNQSSYYSTNCLAFTNGFDMQTSLFYTSGTLTYFDNNWIQFISTGGATSHKAEGAKGIVINQFGSVIIPNNTVEINSIEVVCADNDSKIMAASCIEIYKR